MSSKKYTRFIACAGATAISIAQGIASAQEGSPSGGDAPMRNDWEFTLGVMGAYQPVYLGSDDYKTRPLPILSVRMRNGLFAGTSGIGFRLSGDSPVSAGVFVGIASGRDEDDSDDLRGMGDIKTRPEFGAFLDYRLARGLNLGSRVRYGSGDDRKGLLLDVSVRTMLPIDGQQRLFGGLTATFANEEHMQGFFGVDSSQSLRSGYSAYSPSSGLRDISLNVGYGYSFTPNTSVVLGATYRMLQGDAKDSPLTRKANAASANVGLTYRF